jgi:hypothetical protein
MSTHALIAKKDHDGTVRSVYCHYDGFPQHTGQILRDCYNDPAVIDIVMNFGNLKFITPHVSDIEFYVIDSRIDERALSHPGAKSFLNYGLKSDSDFLYLFEQDRWRCWSTYSKEEIQLDENLGEEHLF